KALRRNEVGLVIPSQIRKERRFGKRVHLEQSFLDPAPIPLQVGKRSLVVLRRDPLLGNELLGDPEVRPLIRLGVGPAGHWGRHSTRPWPGEQTCTPDWQQCVITPLEPDASSLETVTSRALDVVPERRRVVAAPILEGSLGGRMTERVLVVWIGRPLP